MTHEKDLICLVHEQAIYIGEFSVAYINITHHFHLFCGRVYIIVVTL